jgi:hypothetical protein
MVFGITVRTSGLALVIVAATLALRFPTWNDRILFIDEAIYYSFGARLELPGAHVHTHTFDMKPPGGPMTYWLAITVSPQHAITVIHVFTSIAIAATAVLLLITSCLLLETPWPGFWAALLYVLLGSNAIPGGVQGEPFFAFSSLEHFQAPWLALFVLMFCMSLKHQRVSFAVVAGAALAMAAWYKQNVPVLLAPAAAAAVWGVWSKHLSLVRAIVLTAALSVTTLAVMATVPLYYAAIGHFAEWRFYTIDLLIQYSGMGGSYQTEMRMLAASIPLAAIFAAAFGYGVFSAIVRAPAVAGRELRVLLTLGWLALFVALSAGQHKAHYLIQGLPLQCLLIGVLIAEPWRLIAQYGARRRLILAGAYCALLLVPLGISVANLFKGWRDLVALIDRDYYLALHRRSGTLAPLVDYIRTHSQPDDLLYVHSEAPEFYFLTQRRPASGDTLGGGLAHLHSASAADSQLEQLRATPPRFIVQLDYRRYGRAGETVQKWPQLASWVHQHYRERTYIDHAQILEWENGNAWPPPPRDQAEVPLSILPPQSTAQNAGWLRFDRNQAGGPIRIGAHPYPRGIGTHAPSLVTYDLGGAYRTFTADVGIDAATGQRGSAVFSVQVDGVTKFTSPMMRGGSPPLPVEVDVSGVRTLTLAVTPGTDGVANAWANWANARLVRAPS